MHSTPSRRDFLRAASVLTVSAGSGALAGIGSLPAHLAAQETSQAGIKLGLASYTTRSFSLDETIDMTRRLGLKYLCLKEMHLPQNLPTDQIRAAAKKVRAAGIDLYGGGVIYMKTADQVDLAFEYAKAAGMNTIVGVPAHELLEKVDQKIKQYDIRVAIHNHGPGDKVYPTAESAYERIEKLDPRLGLCIDVGHTQRCGIDPATDVTRFADRLLDIHVKDVSEATAKGHCVEMGRGVIDVVSLVRAIKQINYQHVVSFEFEKDGKDPLSGLAESVGYVRGVIASV